jgi:DNA-binding HxlR family transcriptional regulator
MKSVDSSDTDPTRTNSVDHLRVVTTISSEPGSANIEQVALTYRCPRHDLASALAVIGGKWKALIICELSRRSMRYSEIDAALSYVSHRVLTYELQILMKGGVISRSNGDHNLRGHVYSLTSQGSGLYAVIRDLVHWARINQPASEG